MWFYYHPFKWKALSRHYSSWKPDPKLNERLMWKDFPPLSSHVLCLPCIWVVLTSLPTFTNRCFATFYTGPLGLSPPSHHVHSPHREAEQLAKRRQARRCSLHWTGGIRARRCGSLLLQGCVSGMHSEGRGHTLQALFVLSLSVTPRFKLLFLAPVFL